MLIAWARGKKGRDHNGYEDEIVSAVFGPLRYVTSAQRAKVFGHLLECSFRNDDGSNRKDDRFESCDFEFWPNIAKSGRIEPDIKVELTRLDNSKVVILIEAKWKSGLHEGQLKQQWQAAKCGAPSDVRHIFLAMEPHGFSEMGVEDPAHQVCLASLTWLRFAANSKELCPSDRSEQSDPIGCWASDVVDFLHELRQNPFTGVFDISKKTISPFWEKAWYFQPLLMHAMELDSCKKWAAVQAFKSWQFRQSRGTA